MARTGWDGLIPGTLWHRSVDEQSSIMIEQSSEQKGNRYFGRYKGLSMI